MSHRSAFGPSHRTSPLATDIVIETDSGTPAAWACVRPVTARDLTTTARRRGKRALVSGCSPAEPKAKHLEPARPQCPS